MTNSSTRERFRGCLLGLAAGDALGTTLEFRSPGTFSSITDMVGGGPFNLKPGQWTDDTSMALCLADSLLKQGSFDPNDQLDRYIRWWRNGYLSSTGQCFDIGGTTIQALLDYERTMEPYRQDVGDNNAPNGSLMRVAPVPMAYAFQPRTAIMCSGDSSRTTHPSRVCIDACRYAGSLIVGALNGVDKDELLSERHSLKNDYWGENPLHPEIYRVATGSFKLKDPPGIKGSGYVVDALEAALWALYRSEDFEDGCLRAVNLGDDADTTGAIYGQIAGAIYGISAIPCCWRDRLAMRGTIEQFADGLLMLAESKSAKD
mgnify:CR=1 FL=1